MSYFHLCSTPLETGSIIKPGNWGRVIQRAGWGHQHAMRECALESYRRWKCPEKPSRLNCVFLFDDQEAAKRFRLKEDGFRFHHLYEVSLVDPKAGLHRALEASVNHANLGIPFTFDWCDLYWAGESSEMIEGVRIPGQSLVWETIAASPVRIVTPLETA